MVSTTMLVALGVITFAVSANAFYVNLLLTGAARNEICESFDVTSSNAHRTYKQWANKNTENSEKAKKFVEDCETEAGNIDGVSYNDDYESVVTICKLLHALTSVHGLPLLPVCSPCHIASQKDAAGDSPSSEICAANNGACVASGSYPKFSCVCKPGYVFDTTTTGTTWTAAFTPTEFAEPKHDCKKKDIKCDPKKKKNGCGVNQVCHFEQKICVQSCFSNDDYCKKTPSLDATRHCYKDVCVTPSDKGEHGCYLHSDCKAYDLAATNNYKCGPKNICIFNP